MGRGHLGGREGLLFSFWERRKDVEKSKPLLQHHIAQHLIAEHHVVQHSMRPVPSHLIAYKSDSERIFQCDRELSGT